MYKNNIYSTQVHKFANKFDSFVIMPRSRDRFYLWDLETAFIKF